MVKRLSIFSPSVGSGLGKNVFGKDVANHALFRSLLLYGGLDQLDFLNPNIAPADKIKASLIGDTPCQTRVASFGYPSTDSPRQSGTLMRGTADIINLSWDRRRKHATSAYSVIGLIHTVAPPSIRDYIGQALVAPVMPWDALICTSPSIQTAMGTMFEEWHDYLGARFNGTAKSAPLLPLVPLGVEAHDFAPTPSTPHDRASLRQELKIGADDILVLWVGRLSFYEKAFPQPMMLAIQAAAKSSGKRVHFAMAGWFPDAKGDEKNYRHAAKVHAPDVIFHIIDGNDKPRLRRAWAAADVFISLVDNIQETFGITPIEAMASGLPVVVSDWDGYRYTVRDGQDGFLIPTLMGSPSDLTDELVTQHIFMVKSYQQYVGIVAQHTAVHVGIAAARLADLFNSPSLRKQMGEAGRKRILDTFDWRVVAPQYIELATHLAEVRAAAVTQPPAAPNLLSGPNPSRSDPFAAFANFPTALLTPDTLITLDPSFDESAFEAFGTVALTSFAGNWRANKETTLALIAALREKGPMTFATLCGSMLKGPLPTNVAITRDRVQLTVLWLAKMGVLTWA